MTVAEVGQACSLLSIMSQKSLLEHMAGMHACIS